MIGRLLQTLTAVVLYFCLATIIAEAILVSHLWGKWKMDRARLVQMVAVAQGAEPQGARPKKEEEREPAGSEQPSYEQILASRTAKDLNLQLREQSLDAALTALGGEKQLLTQSQEQYAQQRRQYETELRTLEDETMLAGREINRRTLESIKPKQAKELLMQMLRGENTAAVVTLLREMSDSKRAKIVGEFKTPEEAAKVEEVLRLIREGTPEADAAREAQKQLAGKQSKQP